MILQLNNGIKQSLLYGASIALMKGISLLMLPFVAHHISAQEFGRLEVISTLAVIGSIVVGMGLGDTLFRFAGTAKTQQQRCKIASEIFSLTLFIGLISLISSWFIAPIAATWIAGSPSIYEVRVILAVLALEGCIAIPLGWLRMNNRATCFFFASSGRALIQAILVALFLYWGRGVTGILEAGLIAAVLQTIFLSIQQLRDTGVHFSLATAKRSFIYSLPIVVSGLVAFALNGLDRWILIEHATLTDVAEFGIAVKFALAMVLLLQPFGMWWSPRRFKMLNSINGQQKTADFIAMGSSLALLIAVLVALLAPLLITWLLPDTYQQAGQYVVALVLVMLLKELVELFNIGCFNGETTTSQLIINVIASIIGITAMLLLTPQHHVWGIIFALLLAQSVRLFLFYKISQYFLPLNYPIHALLILVVISTLWLLLGSQINGAVPTIIAMFFATLTLLFSAQLLKLINLPFICTKKVTG